MTELLRRTHLPHLIDGVEQLFLTINEEISKTSVTPVEVHTSRTLAEPQWEALRARLRDAGWSVDIHVMFHKRVIYLW